MKRGRPTNDAVRTALRELFESHDRFSGLTSLQKRSVYREIEAVNGCKKEDRLPIVNRLVNQVGCGSSETLPPASETECALAIAVLFHACRRWRLCPLLHPWLPRSCQPR